MKTFGLSAHIELSVNSDDEKNGSALAELLKIEMGSLLEVPQKFQEHDFVLELHATAMDLARQCKMHFSAPVIISPVYF